MLNENEAASLSSRNLSTLAKGTGIAFVGNIVGKIAQIATQVILARLLGPKYFGLYALGMSFLRMTGMFSPLGMGLGVIRYAGIYQKTSQERLKGVILQSLLTAGTIGLLLGGVLYVLAPWLAVKFFSKPELTEVLRWFSVGIWIMAGIRVTAATTRATEKIQYSAFAQGIVEPVSNLILVGVFVILLDWSIKGALFARVLSFSLTLIVLLIFVRMLYPVVFSSRVKAEYSFKEVLTFSLAASWAGVLAGLSGWTDRVLIGYYLPAAEVGIYQAASQVMMIFSIISMTINTIVSPMIANLHSAGENSQLDALLKVSTRWVLYTSIPIILVIVLSSRDVMGFIFGTEYITGATPLVILSVGGMIRVGMGAIGMVMIMTGHQNPWLLISLFMFLLNISLNLYLIPRYGLTGAALGSSVSSVIPAVIGLFQARKLVKVWPYGKDFYKVMLAGGASLLALLSLQGISFDSAAVTLALRSFTSITAYLAVILVLGLNPDDRKMFRMVKGKILNHNQS